MRDNCNEEDLIVRAGEALVRVRERRPLVLCLTNSVVPNWTANCLLALGATPAMMEDASEAAELAAVAGAVLVNVGTLTASQAEAMRAAIGVCRREGVPWVLDPVAHDYCAFRRGVVHEFLGQSPRLVRGNAREIAGLGEAVRGVCTLSTGRVDEICSADGAVQLRLGNGVEMLQRVTGTGCAQGALAAAFCAVESDPVVAAVGAALSMGLAGEMAFERAERPGAFQVALLDALDAVSAEDFERKAKRV